MEPQERETVKILVTGAAGFIGSNLVDRLLADGHVVTGFDNFSTGRAEFLEGALRSPRFDLKSGDLLDGDALESAMRGADFVFHMAANADVRFGTEHPRKDLEQNTIGTANVLEAMRAHGVRRIAFPSTGSVYGEPAIFPTPEDAPFPGADLAVRGVQAGCRGPRSKPIAKASACKVTSFALCLSWESDTRTATSSISISNLASIPSIWMY